MTIYPEDKAHYVFKSSITGKAIERASLAELEEFLQREYPGIDLEAEVESRSKQSILTTSTACCSSRWKTSSSRPHTIEDDALYHSLQVFELALSSDPTTKSFCWRRSCTTSAKDSIRTITAAPPSRPWMELSRSAPQFFIAHHMDALAKQKRLPLERRRGWRLRDFEDLLLFRELDEAGRVPGVQVGTVDEALEFLRELERSNNG